MSITGAHLGLLDIFKGFGHPVEGFLPDFSGDFALHIGNKARMDDPPFPTSGNTLSASTGKRISNLVPGN